jgi:hypothetical protein
MHDLHLVRGSGGTGRGEVIIVIGKIVLLARTALAFTTRARHGRDTDGVVAHGARYRREVRRVGT